MFIHNFSLVNCLSVGSVVVKQVTSFLLNFILQICILKYKYVNLQHDINVIKNVLVNL